MMRKMGWIPGKALSGNVNANSKENFSYIFVEGGLITPINPRDNFNRTGLGASNNMEDFSKAVRKLLDGTKK